MTFPTDEGKQLAKDLALALIFQHSAACCGQTLLGPTCTAVLQHTSQVVNMLCHGVSSSCLFFQQQPKSCDFFVHFPKTCLTVCFARSFFGQCSISLRRHGRHQLFQIFRRREPRGATPKRRPRGRRRRSAATVAVDVANLALEAAAKALLADLHLLRITQGITHETASLLPTLNDLVIWP